MSNFTSPLEFRSTDEFTDGRRRYVLTRTLIWEIGFLGSGDQIVVPEGFDTDFLSLPAFVQMFVSRDGPYAAAGALHDYLYRTRDHRGRSFADAQLHDGLMALGASKFVARTFWGAVRLFGNAPWSSYPVPLGI